MSKKVNKKERIQDSFEDLFKDKNELSEEDYRKIIYDLNDEIYERRRHFIDGMCGYHRTEDDYDRMLKWMILGELKCISTIKNRLNDKMINKQ